MRIRYLLLLPLLIFCCKKNNNGYDANKPSFRKGTKWTLVYKAYDQNGLKVNESEDEYTVVKDTMINGSKYYLDSYGTYFSNKSDGAYYYQKNANREVLNFKYPATVGDSYQITPAGPFCTPHIYIGVQNTDTTHTYGSSIYKNLISYRFDYIITTCQGNNSYSKYLFSPKIGLPVYYSSMNYNTAAYSTVELKSFTY